MITGAHIRLLFCTVIFAGSQATATLSQDTAGGDQPPAAPFGVWIDHTGRGAVEITDCDGKLCGHVVWVRDAEDNNGCGAQIMGNVKKTGKKTWDNGWIYSPERKKRFDVEIKPVNPDKLKLRGYAGVKLFGKTMFWKRAPSDLVLCSKEGEPEQSAREKKPPQKQTKRKDTPKVEKAPEKKQKAAKQPADQDLPEIINPDAAAEESATAEEPREERSARRNRDEPRARNESRRRDDDEDYIDDEREDYDRTETASDECRLSLPYVEITFPCDKDN